MKTDRASLEKQLGTDKGTDYRINVSGGKV